MKKMLILAIFATSSVAFGFTNKAEAQVSVGIGGPFFSVMLVPRICAPPPPGYYYHRHHRCYNNQVWVQGHWIITRRGFNRWIPPHWEWI